MAKNRNKGKTQARRERKQDRRQDRIRERATTDVQLMDQPQVDLQNAMLQQAQEDYLRQLQTARSSFGGAEDYIGKIDQPDFGGIADQLTGWMNNLAPEFGGGGFEGFSPEESAAGTGYAGALAGASLGNLAGDVGRWDAAQAAAEREAAVGGRNLEDNVTQRMEDTMQQYRNTLQNIRADDPWQIKSRTDELTDQAFEQRALREKMANDRAFSQWMQGYLGDQMGGGGGGGFRGGGGGGGGNGGPSVPDRNPGPGRVPTPDGTGHLGARGGAYNAAPGWVDTMRDVRQADTFGSLPQWLKRLYMQQGPGAERWEAAQDLGPNKAQIFRNTRRKVRGLYTDSHPNGPGGNYFGGRGVPPR